MKDLKAFYLKQARDSLKALTNIVADLDQGDIEIQQIRSAATQAEQVTSNLNRLCGVAENERRDS